MFLQKIVRQIANGGIVEQDRGAQFQSQFAVQPLDEIDSQNRIDPIVRETLVDVDIRRGEIVAIVGGSGSGKTVLLDHVLGQHRPDRGRVLALNHGRSERELVDLGRASAAELDQIHTHWGVVFQRNALFSGTVLDNLSLWLDEVRHLPSDGILRIARRALDAVGLPSSEEFLNQDHASLSGGMAKRLAVDRRVIALDLPGHGASDTPDHELGVEEYCEAVLTVLDRLDVQETHIVGHHGGCMLAVNIAVTYPARIRKLVLSGGGYPDPDVADLLLNNPMTRDIPIDAEGDFLLKPWAVYQKMSAPATSGSG